jgi:diguanylate cyclase (GGDEF)-like protein
MTLARRPAGSERNAPRVRGVSYRAALGGLAVVLVVLTVFGITSALRTNSATEQVHVSSQLSDAYQRAHFAVGEEESLERKYRLEPGAVVLTKYDHAATELTDALRDAARIGKPADRVLVAHLLDIHRFYLQAIKRLFYAVDAGDRKRVLAIDSDQVDPRFAAIAARVTSAAAAHRAEATGDLRDLRGTERSILTITPVVFALGLLLLGILTLLLARINRQLATQARDSEHSALHDALTGLPNRVLFADRLEHAIAAAGRDPAPFSVLMLDLDRFKEINDTLGHSVGDRLLREIGPRLTPILRPGDSLARLGGDEFALLLPTASVTQATVICGRVLEAMREPFALGDLSITVDASVGIVTYPTHGQDAETLVQRADVAMYMAKASGQGEALYDPAEDPYDGRRLVLIGDLRNAIRDSELELHYQPKFAANDLHLVGVEALVRWNHPTRGQLPPGEFIPLAEHTGLIRPLTLVVLRQAAHQWRVWRDDGLEVTMAVNLSVANLLDNQLIDDIADILAEEQMPADQLVLEITESTVMTDPGRSIATLERLAAMDIRLSIDDYGTGHSSLAYLRRLPVHELKIDRAFIQHLALNNQDLQIVHSTIALGHSLGLRVVAEGVEDAGVLKLLQNNGCDLVQGFHLGRPVPPDALLDQLRDSAAHTLMPSHA